VNVRKPTPSRSRVFRCRGCAAALLGSKERLPNENEFFAAPEQSSICRGAKWIYLLKD